MGRGSYDWIFVVVSTLVLDVDHGYLILSQPFPAVMRARCDLFRIPLKRVGI